MPIGSSRHRHSVAPLRLGVGIPHHRQHVIERQNAGRLSRSASFRGR
jgi:hypothetical protein